MKMFITSSQTHFIENDRANIVKITKWLKNSSQIIVSVSFVFGLKYCKRCNWKTNLSPFGLKQAVNIVLSQFRGKP